MASVTQHANRGRSKGANLLDLLHEVALQIDRLELLAAVQRRQIFDVVEREVQLSQLGERADPLHAREATA
jgi:hypothetical protein